MGAGAVTVRPECLLAVLLGAALPAQELLWQRSGVVTGPYAFHEELFGGPTAFLGDVDGDGWSDFAMLSAAIFNGQADSRVLTVSGRDASTLRTFVDPTRSLWRFVGAGDADGDGLGDYAISYALQFGHPLYPMGLVEVRSGRDDSLLWSIIGTPWPSTVWGEVIASNLDLNGDGRPDLLVSAYRAAPPVVYAYASGGQPLYTVPLLGSTLGKVGDVDGDGCDEFVVGGWTTNGTDDSFTGAYLVSGKTGQILRRGLPREGFGIIGTGASFGCGDVDGDGVPDFGASTFPYTFILGGSVRVFSGANAELLWEWWDPRFGIGDRIAAGDLDLDGVHDLLFLSVPCLQLGQQGLDYYSLRDGSLVTSLCGPNFVSTYTTIGPAQPGSPFPVFLLSDNSYGRGYAPFFGALGRVSCYRASPPGVQSLGANCTGTLTAAPQIGLTNRSAAGMQFHLRNAPAGTPAALLLGLSSTSWNGLTLPYSLSALGLPACNLYTSVELALPVKTGTTLRNQGYASLTVPLPLSTSGVGMPIHGQWFVGEPQGLGLTGALSWPY